MVIIELLKDFFPEIIDVEFTAKMEEKLDNIEDGKLNSIEVLKDFYEPFSKRLEVAEKQMQKVELEPDYSDQKCPPQCEKLLVYRFGRFGRFLACSGFPECRYTRNIKTELGSNARLVAERCSRNGRAKGEFLWLQQLSSVYVLSLEKTVAGEMLLLWTLHG